MMRSITGPLVALAVMAAIAIAVVAVLRVPDEAPLFDAVGSTTTLAESESSSDAQPTEEVALLRVFGTGQVVDQVLAGIEFHFSQQGSVGVDVTALPSAAVVWALTEENRNRADVVEVGFRLDAVTGAADQEFAPFDPSAVPALSAVPADFVLDANGLVPFIDAGLGLARTADAPAVDDWDDVAAALADGATVVLPSLTSDLAVVFAWVLGDGDPELGVERYASLIEAGAHPVRSTSELTELAGEGGLVAVWSSAGVTWAARTTDLEFVVPRSGAVILPGFTAVLAESELADVAHDWFDLRLGTELQTSMTFSQIFGRFGEPLPIPPIPVVPTGRDTRSVTGFDPHSGDAYAVLDWRAIGESLETMRGSLAAIPVP